MTPARNETSVPSWLAWPEHARPHAAARWRRTRSLGRWSFIWRGGIVGWGLPAGAFTAFLAYFRAFGLQLASSLPTYLWLRMAAAMIVFPLLGYVLGTWLWEVSEENYRRSMERDGKSPEPLG